MWVLELNDAEIVLSRGVETAYREPGVAMLADNGVQFGNEALRASRLHPRQAQNQYWQRLNAEPVVPGAPNVSNQADLVYLQLEQIKLAGTIGAEDTVVVAVPSHCTPEQLSLLLGIAAETPVPITTMVDLAVAAASTRPLPERCKFLDVSLHRAVISTLEVRDQVRRVEVEEVAEAGLVHLIEGWVDAVADRFVAETRFDPLRIAETEQQVFNQVYERIARDGSREEIAVEIQHEGSARRIDVRTAVFAQKSLQRYELLAQHLGAPTTLVVTHRVTRLPGLVRLLEQRGHHLEWLTPEAIAEGVNRHPGLLAQQEAVRFVTALPSAGGTSQAKVPITAQPTHLLCRGRAVRIGDGLRSADHPASEGGAHGFTLTRDEAGVRLVPDSSTTVNGRTQLDPYVVAIGDVMTTGADEFVAIRVSDG